MLRRSTFVRIAIVAATLFAASAGIGCHRPPPPEGAPPRAQHGATRDQTNAVANSFFGAANARIEVPACAGRVALENGSATIADSCFTGDTNVVVCTDATSASPVKCAPEPGKLAIIGTANDMISYARIR
ncbi:MAG TPA: hypothetical protein VEF03_13530 [Candidatus Binataceae bacterium]|nr:hypothetical protein [Candidatus Binataceae bacterium]